ncbi:MAG: tRNA (adenosine(37)-N6)-threonylcarbamoyltransferase complex ATPase subunit type 1 TsaE [Prevotellaceae bacterium]|jgi:tRNA threonylcarbamoyladenosine biosynthesis protein TsaE|nr:tRNA (adenosine(37)-N6)-threonylcarbamoyltransferase complex ATPase subunit type 1 TsaE [Prevotellaceae bacterium]
MNITISGPDDLPLVAKALLPALQHAKVAAFHGDMGIGKTTLIKALCRALGTTDTVNSPSFALVNEYRDGGGNPVYHFDFYRIQNIEEVYDLGYEEYFYGGHVCLIEWPEKVHSILPPDALHVYLQLSKKGNRIIRF